MKKLTITVEKDTDLYLAKVNEFDCVGHGKTISSSIANLADNLKWDIHDLFHGKAYQDFSDEWLKVKAELSELMAVE